MRLAAAARLLNSGIHQLREAHASGVRELAAMAGGTFTRIVNCLADGPWDGEERWRLVRMAVWHLWKDGRESMDASILSTIVQQLHHLQRRSSTSPSPAAQPAADDSPCPTTSIADTFISFIQRQQAAAARSRTRWAAQRPHPIVQLDHRAVPRARPSPPVSPLACITSSLGPCLRVSVLPRR